VIPGAKIEELGVETWTKPLDEVGGFGASPLRKRGEGLFVTGWAADIFGRRSPSATNKVCADVGRLGC
jgi:hypothetical protein